MYWIFLEKQWFYTNWNKYTINIWLKQPYLVIHHDLIFTASFVLPVKTISTPAHAPFTCISVHCILHSLHWSPHGKVYSELYALHGDGLCLGQCTLRHYDSSNKALLYSGVHGWKLSDFELVNKPERQSEMVYKIHENNELNNNGQG